MNFWERTKQKVMQQCIDEGELKQVQQSKEQVIETLEALGIYITESGMCDRTDDCGSTESYGKETDLLSNDGYVFHLMTCYDCNYITCSVGLFEEVYQGEIERLRG